MSCIGMEGGLTAASGENAGDVECWGTVAEGAVSVVYSFVVVLTMVV